MKKRVKHKASKKTRIKTAIKKMFWILTVITFLVIAIYLVLSIISRENDVVNYEKQFSSVEDFQVEMSKIFSDNYAEGFKTYFLYGNSDKVTMRMYTPLRNGEIQVYIGEPSPGYSTLSGKFTEKQIIPENNIVELKIIEKSYRFEINKKIMASIKVRR